MESSQYLLAWTGYLVGALGCLLVWLRITSGIGLIGLRRVLQISAAALLFTPWPVAPEQPALAPALMVALFDSLLQGPEAMFRAGIPLLWVLVGAWALIGIYHGVERAMGKQAKKEPESAKQRMEPNADV